MLSDRPVSFLIVNGLAGNHCQHCHYEFKWGDTMFHGNGFVCVACAPVHCDTAWGRLYAAELQRALACRE